MNLAIWYAVLTGVLTSMFVFMLASGWFRKLKRPMALMFVLGWAIFSLAAVTQINLATQVFGTLPAANGGLNANAAAFTGLLRDASGTATASELSGDCTTSGSNVITCQKDNGTTIPTNAAADQVLLTTASATGSWASVTNCPAGALQYTTASHTFSCGTVLTGTFADQEIPTGTINGVTTAFTLAHTPNPAASLTCFENGVAQRAGGADFTLATATITFGVAPPTGTTLICNYRY